MATQELVAPHQRIQTSFSNAGSELAKTRSTSEKVAGALGWFSIGLGLTELIVPRTLSRWIGVPQRPAAMRLMGMREVAAGIGILAARRPGPWVWARVAGDVVDMAALFRASHSRRSNSGRMAVAMGSVAGVTVLDALCARRLCVEQGTSEDATHFTASTAINRSPEECYRHWRDLEKLPTFFENLRSVQDTGDNRSHWVATIPGGREISWEAEITEDTPNELIAWRSVEGSEFQNWGRVRFAPAPGGRGTLVRVLMDYELPASAGGSMAATFLGKDPGQQVRKNLIRFKQMLEAGEIATTEGQSAGRRSGATWLDRMARI